MTWSNRLCKRTVKTSHGTSILYGIHEAFYNSQKEICTVTTEPITIDVEQWDEATEEECVKSLKETIERIKHALDKPIIDLDNITYVKFDGEDEE